MPNHRTALSWLWLSLIVILLDQVSKQIADFYLLYHQPVAVLPLFNLTLVYNTGAAFSFLADAGGWQRYFLTGVSLIASVVIIVMLSRISAEKKRQALALSLILGGAVGNLIDRAVFGYVIDFFDIYYRDWHYPAFNVADAAITIGAVLLFVDLFFGQNKE